MNRFEYKFVRLGEGFIGARGAAEKQYQDVIHEHAGDGWRLVQIFAPGTGVYGGAKYYELVFERPVAESAR
jgi:hypothetical protein